MHSMLRRIQANNSLQTVVHRFLEDNTQNTLFCTVHAAAVILNGSLPMGQISVLLILIVICYIPGIISHLQYY